MNSIDYFEKNRNIYLSEVVSKNICKDLSDHMHNLLKEGKLVQDEQCPLSWSVYGDPKFDALLSNLAKPLSAKLGVELLPTYTYARLYQPGDILKKHTDRPSCEISGTMTLGHDPDSTIWPIFVGKDEKKFLDFIRESFYIDIEYEHSYKSTTDYQPTKTDISYLKNKLKEEYSFYEKVISNQKSLYR